MLDQENVFNNSRYSDQTDFKLKKETQIEEDISQNTVIPTMQIALQVIAFLIVSILCLGLVFGKPSNI